jgi:hypothetical protein
VEWPVSPMQPIGVYDNCKVFLLCIRAAQQALWLSEEPAELRLHVLEEK